jgi:hypothetical protein
MVPILWSSQVMEQILGVIKNEKISASVMVVLIGVAWWAHAWAEEVFVKKGEFDTLQTTVTDGFESIEINDAGQIIRDIKLEILITKATQGSQEEKDRLADKLEHALAYKQCLVERKPNCRHLKEVE